MQKKFSFVFKRVPFPFELRALGFFFAAAQKARVRDPESFLGERVTTITSLGDRRDEEKETTSLTTENVASHRSSGVDECVIRARRKRLDACVPARARFEIPTEDWTRGNRAISRNLDECIHHRSESPCFTIIESVGVISGMFIGCLNASVSKLPVREYWRKILRNGPRI